MFWNIVILAVAVLLAVNICKKRYTLFTAVPKNPEDDDHFGRIVTDEETGEQYYSNGISSLNTYFSWINDLLNIYFKLCL